MNRVETAGTAVHFSPRRAQLLKFSPGDVESPSRISDGLAARKDQKNEAEAEPRFQRLLYMMISMAISGTDSLEVPTIYKAYVRAYPHKIWPYMVLYIRL